MKPEHRSALLAIAARRGQKGFSELIAEAIDEYLRGERKRLERTKTLLASAGILSQREAQELRESTAALRNTWR